MLSRPFWRSGAFWWWATTIWATEKLAAAGAGGPFAEQNGWDRVVEDVEALRAKTAAEHPGLPYFLLGHSMGSFVTRTWLIRYPGRADGAILCGTGQQSPAVVGFGRAFTGALIRLHGPLYRSELVRQLAFGAYNRGFSPRRTETTGSAAMKLW